MGQPSMDREDWQAACRSLFKRRATEAHWHEMSRILYLSQANSMNKQLQAAINSEGARLAAIAEQKASGESDG
jgi:hypothetical protein